MEEKTVEQHEPSDWRKDQGIKTLGTLRYWPKALYIEV